jgi:hypothetical protein
MHQYLARLSLNQTRQSAASLTALRSLITALAGKSGRGQPNDRFRI